MRLEELGQLKKSNDLISNGTHDLPACSIVPQPTTLPRAVDLVYLVQCRPVVNTVMNDRFP
jgi:hypothetical protein